LTFTPAPKVFAERILTKQGQALISEVYLLARQLIVLVLELVLELGATPAVIRASTVDF
jgi:hypothetical protein